MKKMIISTVTAAILMGISLNAATSAQVKDNALKSAKLNAQNNQVKIVQEAVKAVYLTKKVFVDLDKKDTKLAIKDLEDAIGKLEVILADKNSPKLLPVDTSMSAVEYVGSVEDLKKSLDIVSELLDDGKVQEARKILSTLQSEIDLVSINLPLASYPDALKLAAKYLHSNNIEGAKVVLAAALNTMVKEVVVVPIPLLKADSLIAAASEVAKKDRDQAIKHLNAAKEELKIAQTLGYLSDSDVTYKILNDKIDEVEKEIKGKNEVAKLFEDLKVKMKSFKEKITK